MDNSPIGWADPSSGKNGSANGPLSLCHVQFSELNSQSFLTF